MSDETTITMENLEASEEDRRLALVPLAMRMDVLRLAERSVRGDDGGPEDVARAFDLFLGRLVRGLCLDDGKAGADGGHFARFAFDCLERAKGERLQMKVVYAAYVSWCMDEGQEAQSQIAFSRAIREMFERKVSCVVYLLDVRLRDGVRGHGEK